MEQKESVIQYREFIKNINICDVVLAETVFHRKIAPDDIVHGADELSYKYKPAFSLVRCEQGILVALAELALKGYSKQPKQPRKMIMSIKIKYQLEYKMTIPAEYSQEAIDRFIRFNVPVNIWPYFRENVSTLTTKAGFSAIVLNVLRS